MLVMAGQVHALPNIQAQTFTDSPDPVPATTTFDYTLQVSNINVDTGTSVAGVVAVIPVPAQTEFVSVADPSCSYVAPEVICNIGTMAGTQDRFITITLRATAGSGNSFTNTATVSAAGETDSTINQTTTITSGADLQLTKTGAPDPVVAGANVTYTLTASNLGPDTASGLSIVDNLPPNVAYVSSSGSGWGCSAAGSTVTCNRSGALATGANSTLTIVGQVQNSISGNITNSATLSATTPDGLPNNNTATATIAVLPGADLRITKTASPQPMIASDAATFVLSPRNTGPDAGATVTVSDTLPNGFTAIAASGSNWSCSVVQLTRVVTCTRASLPVGATDDITVTATAPDNSVVPAGGLTTSNTATIGGTTADPDNGNNSGSVNFSIQRDGADLSVQKTKSPNPVAQGSPLTSTLRATNNGPRAVTASDTITLTDTLPSGEDYSGPASFTNNGWSCTFAAPAFTCMRPGPLAIGATTPDLTLVTDATAASMLTNQGCVSLSGTSLTDPNSSNDCVGTSSDSTAARADLTIVKAQTLSTVATGDSTNTYTLTISNNGPNDSANVVVTDTIPMRTTLAGGTGITPIAAIGNQGSPGSCAVSGATVTCNYATLRNGEIAVVSIAVARPMADGSFTNTASINSTSVGDPNRGNNSSSVNTTVDPVADVEVQSKTVTPNPVSAGVDATYVISFRNNGPSTADNVVLSDVFAPTGGDSGYDVRSITASKGSASFNAGTNTVTNTVGSMNAGEVQTLTVVVRPRWMASPPVGRHLDNTATIATTSVESNAANNSQSATLTINPASVDLIVNKTDVQSFVGIAPDPLGYDATAPASNLVTYRVTVTNNGPSEATDVGFSDVYAAPNGKSVTLLCDSDSQFACSGAPICTAITPTTVTGPVPLVVACDAGNLESSATYTRYLRYQINSAPAAAGDTYTNEATVSSNEDESNAANNVASEPTAVRAKADLQVTSKTAIIAAPPLQYGQTFQWEIRVRNNGPGMAYQSVLTDTLPTNMELVAPFNYSIANGTGGACSATGITGFNCNLGDIDVGAGFEQTITVDVLIRRPASAPFPSSYVNTASVSTFSIDLIPANNSNSGTVSLVKSSISGRVYRDHNNNAVIDGGENGISGVTLTLAGQDIFNNPVSRSATSDASGNYIFDNLEQADATGYTITETQPANYADGLESVGTAPTGTAPGGAVSATVGNNTITQIVLDKDQAAIDYNFGELRNNTLGGRIFADNNNNGTQQTPAELGIANVTVTLTGTDARGAVVNRTTTTNSSGDYSFANVLPGTYTLAEAQPSTYLDGIDTVGNRGGSAAVNDVFSAIALTDTNGTGYNFAELPGSIGGRVWRDVDRDGVIDAGEVGINNVTLTLTGTDALGNAVSRTTTTDSSGNYSFTALPAGTFTITETQPAGYGSSTPNSIAGVTIVAAGTGTGHDFGDTTASLSGNVFFDRNSNGSSDGSDNGIAGVSLTLTGNDAAGTVVSRTTTTDASGNYSFTDILAPNGSGYTVTETQPTAYSNGAVTAGSAGGTASQVNNRVSAIVLSSASDATGYNFAELGTVISGTVYRDVDRDSAHDAGEPGLSGVTITLRDSGGTVIATTTTAADGSYSFPAQPGGSYTIDQTQPAGYLSGPENTSNSVAISLVAGTPAVVNFGESTGSLAGVVFLDSNNNGVQNGGEIGLPGVALTLSGTDTNGAAVNATTVTNASGIYTFNDLLAGTYTITETHPAAFGDGSDVLAAGNVGGTAGNDVYSDISLPVGAQATGYVFGELGSAVTGVVYRDANRDGSQQAGDTAIANVTVTLRDAGNAIVATTTTAADGSYLFAGVAAGNYSVVETQPAGYGSSTASPDSVAIVVPAGGSASANFADTLSTIAGSVFIDLNNNGVRDSGESGINGITITLTGTDAAGAAVNRSASTDGSGNYVFIDVLTPNGAGYQLSEPTQPTAYADGTDRAGSAGGSAANDVINGISLPVNTDATDYTFGELGTTISGVVFKDVNGNGAREAGDTPIAGVVVTLRDAGGTIVATTTTATDGSYSFSGLPAGSYSVDETQPNGYGSSTPNSRSVTVAAGASATADFGETVSSIAGAVWSDTNNNGVRDSGEPGIANVTITLTGTDANSIAINRTTTTLADGNFVFDDLLSGSYTLSETQPAAYADGIDVAGSAGGTVNNDVISAIALPVGTAATQYLFGERGQSITGRVWLDTNRNASIDTTETGISGVVITLRDANGVVVATTTTAADGTYSFANIPAGNYTVEEMQPNGYGSSTPDSVVVVLGASGLPTVVDFGETAGSFAGVVYNDSSNNGTRDANEPPIAGVTITLTGTDARGNVVSRTTTTAVDGSYQFANVVGGSYALTETQPSGFGDGIDVVGTAGGSLANDAISAIALGATVDATGYNFAEVGANASIAGTVWRDNDHDRVRNTGETVVPDWIVELLQMGVVVQTTTTDASGDYLFTNVAPGSGYEVRFREPTSTAVYGRAVTNENGFAAAPGVVSPANPGGADYINGTLLSLTLAPGASLTQQSLPLDPMGVVYDSVSRLPVAGATVVIGGPAGFDPNLHLLGGAGNATQVTGSSGFYQYILLPGAPSGTYTLTVTPPPGRYTPGQSALIPVCAQTVTVGALPEPALVQISGAAPASSAALHDPAACPANSAGLAGGQGSTQYFLSFNLTPGVSANLLNNHIPVDPILGGALSVTKTTPLVNVSRGDLVPYTITVTNNLNAQITNIDVRDQLPPGFKYRGSSASANGVATEPMLQGRNLTWQNQSFAPSERKIYKLVLVVGAGVSEGEYVNQAYALNNLVNTNVSNIATASVRIVPDPVFDCSDIIGKVFDDRNANGHQDDGENGIANVRLATVNGVLVTTDAEGRYHIACAAIPNEYRGSNFVVKLDARTLPSGYRITTENPGVARVTRGKMVKLNFGATIHRVVRLEVSDAAFVSGSVELQLAWRERVVNLTQLLRDKPSIVRVAYIVAATEDKSLAARRKQNVIKQIREQWEAQQCCYPLEVEDESEVQQ